MSTDSAAQGAGGDSKCHLIKAGLMGHNSISLCLSPELLLCRFLPKSASFPVCDLLHMVSLLAMQVIIWAESFKGLSVISMM